MKGGPVTGGGFRRYGLKVRPSFVSKVFTSDPVNGESRSARSRGRMEGCLMVAFLFSWAVRVNQFLDGTGIRLRA